MSDQARLLSEMYEGNPSRVRDCRGLQLRRRSLAPRERDARSQSEAHGSHGSRGWGGADGTAHARPVPAWIYWTSAGGTRTSKREELRALRHYLAIWAGVYRLSPTPWARTGKIRSSSWVSEFGRAFRENGNRGRPWAWLGLLVMGGSISGGRVVGEQQRLEHNTLFQDRDFPVLNDHRAVLGGLFRRMWICPRAARALFPNVVRRI